MSNKLNCIIEVKVPSGSKGWQKAVNSELKQALENLKLAVEELGGRVYIRY
jgi:hypothetical protein